MAKKTKSPITLICERCWYNRFDKEEWMQSFTEHQSYTNNLIHKAIKNKDKEDMYFCMEHLIHERCDIDLSRQLVKFIRGVEWIM